MKPLIRGPIAGRLFLFNILIVFMPVAGFFSLSLYEDSLLADLESAMVQQGRIVSAWLGEGSLSEIRAKEVLVSLRKKQTARIRIVDADGTLLADSALLEAAAPAMEAPEAERIMYPEGYTDEGALPEKQKAETTFLYRALSLPVRLVRKYILPPETPLGSADFYSGKTVFDGSELKRALAGSYGAITRISSGGQTSVTLYSALPIVQNGETIGAVLVSQSTYRILESLYAFRLEIGKVFVLSLVAAALLSLLLAFTISRPLSRLKKEAEAVIAGKARSLSMFHLTGRNDEIDRLSASLSTLVRELHRQINLSENFASDAAHEIRNRISGIRNAAELIAGGSPEETNSSISLILEDTARMERVISALRELAKIEAGTKENRTEDTARVLEGVARAMQERYPKLAFSVTIDDGARAFSVPVTGEHLEIIAENLLENAASFSPDGGTVYVTMRAEDGRLILKVRDEGRGIPEEHRERVFERFFSFRNGEEDGLAGIGLWSVEVIMRKAGGSVFCANHRDGGAEFTLVFPG